MSRSGRLFFALAILFAAGTSLRAETLQTDATAVGGISLDSFSNDPNFSFSGAGRSSAPTANVDLGAATQFTVLALNGDITHSGPSGPDAAPFNVTGNAGIAVSGKKFTASGSVSYGGSLYLHTGSTFNSSAQGVPQPQTGPAIDSFLTQARQDAINASQAATALGAHPTATYGTIKNNLTISQAFQGNYVFDITGISFSGNKVLTLSAPAGSSFLLNVSSQLELTSGSILVAGGLTAANVLVNYTGTKDIKFSGGGNASRIDGTLLAPDAIVKISPGYVGGGIIAKAIQASSGADVIPEASTTKLMLFGLLLGGAGFRRFKRASTTGVR